MIAGNISQGMQLVLEAGTPSRGGSVTYLATM
jgi:hypothetical protein